MTDEKYTYLEYRFLRAIGKTKPVKKRGFRVLTSKLLVEIFYEEEAKWERAGITKNSAQSDISGYYIKEYAKYVSSTDKICQMRYKSGGKILQNKLS